MDLDDAGLRIQAQDKTHCNDWQKIIVPAILAHAQKNVVKSEWDSMEQNYTEKTYGKGSSQQSSLTI